MTDIPHDHLGQPDLQALGDLSVGRWLAVRPDHVADAGGEGVAIPPAARRRFLPGPLPKALRPVVGQRCRSFSSLRLVRHRGIVTHLVHRGSDAGFPRVKKGSTLNRAWRLPPLLRTTTACMAAKTKCLAANNKPRTSAKPTTQPVCTPVIPHTP